MSKKDIILCYHENPEASELKKNWNQQFIHALSEILKILNAPSYNLIHFTNEKELPKSLHPDLLILIASTSLLSNLDYLRKIKTLEEILIAKNKKLSIILVTKTQYSESIFPEFLLDKPVYEFFKKTGNRIAEFKDFYDYEKDSLFWMKVVDLGYEVFNLLTSTQQNITQGLNIFLAETGSDLSYQREMIKRELKSRGGNIFPEKKLPLGEEEIKDYMYKTLRKCDFSIHLIGNEEGEVVRDSGLSLVEMQHSIASEYSATAISLSSPGTYSFKRIIWLSSDAANATEKQKAFIQNLKKNAEALKEAEFFNSSLEELKLFISELLEKKKRNSEVNTKIKEKKVYLIYEEGDLPKISIIDKYLKDSGVIVYHPEFTKNIIDYRMAHQQYLTKSDAFLIYYSEHHSWLLSKIQDILKAQGIFRTTPLLATGIYFEKDIPENIIVPEKTMIIKSDGKQLAASLQPFVNKLLVK